MPFHSLFATRIYSSRINVNNFSQKLACQSYVKQQNERMPIEFPWMVFKHYFDEFHSFSNSNILFSHSKAALGYLIFQSASYEVTFDCSGVVISEFFVLTAAHCVKPSRAPVVVRFGKVSKMVFHNKIH